MFCGNCGFKLPDGASFCPQCGTPAPPHYVDEEITEKLTSGEEADVTEKLPEREEADVTERLPAHEDDARTERLETPHASLPSAPTSQGRKFPVPLLVVLGLGACALAALLVMNVSGTQPGHTSVQPQHDSPSTSKQLSVSVSAEGYDTSTDTPVPIRLEGHDSEGTDVSLMTYYGTNTPAPEVAPGTYTATVTASPLTDDGTFYDVSAAKAEVTVTDDADATGADATDADATGAGATVALTLTPVSDPATITDQQIEDSKAVALEAGVDKARVDKLVTAVTDARAKATQSAADAQRQKFVDSYNATLEKYQAFVARGYASADGDPQALVCLETGISQGLYQQEDITYAYVDLAGDDLPELVVRLGEEECPIGIFASDGTNVTECSAGCQELMGVRESRRITSDGRIMVTSSGGAMYNSYSYLKAIDGAFTTVDTYMHDGFASIPYTHNDAEISEEEYVTARDESQLSGVEWKPLADFGNGIPSAQESQEQGQAQDTSSTHVATEYYEFDVPSYWAGRVETVAKDVGAGYGGTALYLAGHAGDDSYLLCYVQCESNEYTPVRGDYISPLCGTTEGDGYYIVVYCQEDAQLIWEQDVAGHIRSLSYTDEEKQELVDLCTGGACTYDDLSGFGESGTAFADGLPLLREYLGDTLCPTVTPV